LSQSRTRTRLRRRGSRFLSTGAPALVPPRSRSRAGPRKYRSAAAALDDDWPDVLKALRAGLRDKDAGKAARTAIAYVQLVYGRQLRQPRDEGEPAGPLDVASMSREERDALKRRILQERPDLAEGLRPAEA
jgi:hypothetical protein